MRPLMAAVLLLTAIGAQAGTQSSPDHAFTWEEGAPFLLRFKTGTKGRRRGVRTRLPALPEGWRRRLLFGERAPYFCVLDERAEEIGLHLDAPRGASGAKALVLASVLRLVDSKGRVRWTRRMREEHLVGSKGDARSHRLGPDGTLAVLLQDGDPYSRTRPLLLVLDRKGRETLRLDYAGWTRIDDFTVADDGTAVAVRGVGRIPEEETWGPAVGFYRLDEDESWVRSVPPDAGGALKRADPDQGVCCVREGGGLYSFTPSGVRVRAR